MVQELFLTETARKAQVVLPACCFAEKEGTYTSLDRRVRKLDRVVPPPGDSLPDGNIFMKLSCLLGFPMDYASPSEIMDEINVVVGSYGGIRYERVVKEEISWPCPDTSHPGTSILYRDGFKGKKARLITPAFSPPEDTDASYPFTLVTGGLLFHSGSISLMSPQLKEICSKNYVEISRDDAKKLGIKAGEEVLVKSRKGTLRVESKVSRRPLPGIVFMPHHFSPGVNLLMGRGQSRTGVALERAGKG